MIKFKKGDLFVSKLDKISKMILLDISEDQVTLFIFNFFNFRVYRVNFLFMPAEQFVYYSWSKISP